MGKIPIEVPAEYCIDLIKGVVCSQANGRKQPFCPDMSYCNRIPRPDACKELERGLQLFTKRRKKLRLILFSDCNRSCEGCCNKDWDVDNLPEVDSYVGYDEILLTGGEPMLSVSIIRRTVKEIREQNSAARIYLYTAHLKNKLEVLDVLGLVDGLTVTLHEQDDVNHFIAAAMFLSQFDLKNKSLRLNVFKEVDFGYWMDKLSCDWKIKGNIEWLGNCPLPEGEVLMRLPKRTCNGNQESR